MSYQKFLDAFYDLATEEPEVLQAVYEKVADQCREALLLQFGHKRLVFTANPDDDTLDVRLEEAPSPDTAGWTRVDCEKPWHELVVGGSNFGWGWVTINQQGYCDGVLLSFDGLTPTLLLSVGASSISVSKIVPEQRAAPVISRTQPGR